MDSQTKVAKHRLSVLELAEQLGNITLACKQRGMPRNWFYEYKRRFQTHGLEGLKDMAPIPKSHPHWYTDEEKAKIIELALLHPSWSSKKLEAISEEVTGKYLNNASIQRVLGDADLGSRYQRWLAMEKKNAAKPIKLNKEQILFLEKFNPNFKERHVESSKPGELLSQDTFFVGHFKGIGKLYLHAVVDTFSSFGFGSLQSSKRPEAAVAVLHNEVIPFYKQHRIQIRTVLTDNGREYCGTDAHAFQIFLELHEIEHRTTRIKRPQSNGFVERFNRTVLDEFFRLVLRKKIYKNIESLQRDLDTWLEEYNYRRPHLGYRNHGRKPWETIQLHLKKK